ncbi:cupin domain-containing protein [Pseudaminobacter soli (ex Li et al. 2025)]|uniref:Cupin domain-containing protein n=1 Tax=Pseudaminobacter soli (ex Li et al. 2025) TaxID=1295366 RepID=A0A2P7SJN8_9HYPH|nr:cupin domain-containing protein [Mesorhizobium soli]PSJ62709.1 cupin domain-containing protein [Mesorhizobium soli]
MSIDVTTTQNGETRWVVADRIRFLGGLAGSNLELVEVEVPPGSGTPPHSHASPELFYVIDGEITIRHFATDRPPTTVAAGAGTSVRIERNAPHNYMNESGKPARMLVLIEPSMTAFFREIGTAEPQVQPDFARIGAAMQRHGIQPLEMVP